MSKIEAGSGRSSGPAQLFQDDVVDMHVSKDFKQTPCESQCIHLPREQQEVRGRAGARPWRLLLGGRLQESGQELPRHDAQAVQVPGLVHHRNERRSPERGKTHQGVHSFDPQRGWMYEADPRHAESMIFDQNLEEAARGSFTGGSDEAGEHEQEPSLEAAAAS